MTTQERVTIRLGLIFLIMLMDIIGLLLLSPVAPFLVRQYADSALAVTLVVVIYAAAQFFAAPLMGKLGDRYGRRPVLLISLLGQAGGYALFGLGGALWVLYLARFIGGVTGGNLSTASAYIADISKPEERPKNFALIGIAWSLGLILGPALGGVLGKLSLQAPAFAAAGLSFLNLILGVFLLPESLPKAARNPSPLRWQDFNPIYSIYEMAIKPGLGGLLLATALFNFAFNGVGSTSNLFMIDKFGANPEQVGWLMMLAGLALAVVQFLLVQPVVRRFGEKRVALTGLITQAAGNLAIFWTPVFWMIFPINMLVAAFGGFVWPTMTTLNTSRVQHREVGLLMGVTTAIGSLTNILAPLTAGAIYDQVMVGAPYWMGAALFLLAAFVLWRQPLAKHVSVQAGAPVAERVS